MPGWEPLLPPLEATEPAAEVQASARPQRRMTKPKPPKSQWVPTKRAYADPFAADDTGANCIRCGYLVSPAREKRGLMTCLQCR